MIPPVPPVNGHTYGTWLPGDPRGWRDKKHRTHVEGDYKNPPPPGYGDELLERSKSLLKHPPVRLSPPQREVAGRAMVDSLRAGGFEPLVLSLDALHYHILARFRDRRVRRFVGQAKLNAWYRLRERWDVKEVWQRLCDVTPIEDREHQVRVFHYIQNHKNVGAWIWTFREGLYWRTPAPVLPPPPPPPPLAP